MRSTSFTAHRIYRCAHWIGIFFPSASFCFRPSILGISSERQLKHCSHSVCVIPSGTFFYGRLNRDKKHTRSQIQRNNGAVTSTETSEQSTTSAMCYSPILFPSFRRHRHGTIISFCDSCVAFFLACFVVEECRPEYRSYSDRNAQVYNCELTTSSNRWPTDLQAIR